MNWLEMGYQMYGHNADAEQLASPRVIKSRKYTLIDPNVPLMYP